MSKPIDWNDEEHRRLIFLWMRQAELTPPNPRIWGIFVADILRASLDYRSAGDNDSSRLEHILGVAVAINTFMDKEPLFSGHLEAQGSMLPLLSAIADLKQGRQPSLFNANRAGNRPPLSVAEANTAGAAARAVTELMKSGSQLDAAAHRNAQAVRKGRCAGHDKCTPERVKGWRNRIHEGEGSISRIAIDRYKAPLPKRLPDDARSRADFLLQVLRHGVRFR